MNPPNTYFECRWNLYFALENDRGPKSPVLKAFNDYSVGGDHMLKEYLSDAAIVFQKVLQATGRKEAEIKQFCEMQSEFVKEEYERIAGVLARWQTNSHNFAICTQMDQSVLFRFTSRMQHSCDPNVLLCIDSDTGTCVTKTL